MAEARHKRETGVRRRPKAAAIAAAGLGVSLTASAVVLGVTHPSSGGEHLVALNAPSASATADLRRSDSLSRGGAREADPRLHPAAPRADARKAGPELGPALPAVHRVSEWTTSALNLWPSAAEQHEQAGLLPAGTRVTALGPSADGRDEILVDGAARWVTSGYLTTTKPAPAAKPAATATSSPASAATPAAGLSDAPCPDMSVEQGLAADTIRVYRAVCHAFPQVTTYYGWGARAEHDTGHAIDVMVYGNKALGDEIAAWAQAHAAELNLYDVLWYQHIWTPVRASEGWRLLPDRGSPTANHMDHVHIGTN